MARSATGLISKTHPRLLCIGTFCLGLLAGVPGVDAVPAAAGHSDAVVAELTAQGVVRAAIDHTGAISDEQHKAATMRRREFDAHHYPPYDKHRAFDGNVKAVIEHTGAISDEQPKAATMRRQEDPPVVPYWPPGKENPVIPPNVAGRIVGGEEVNPQNRYPYQVALTQFFRGGQYCGGSLIAPGWVLSAAHCGGYGSYVQIGRWDLRADTEIYENIEVDDEFPHPDYDNRTYDMDFMLLKLKTPSQYPPVSIDDGPPVSIDDGSPVRAMGWGTTSSGGSSSGVLREVEVDVVGNIECNSKYSGDVTYNMICAASPGKDSCQGDSGGPLIIRGGSHSDDVVVGVVSWGIGCARPDAPGVYSRVTKAYKWITQISSAPTCPDIKGKFNLNAGLPTQDGRRKKLRKSCRWIRKTATRKAKQCKKNKVFKKCLCTCLPTGTAASLNEID